MVFIKHNSLKSGIFFNPIFIPGFSGPRIFRVQVFQGLGFSRSESRVQGPGSTVQVQGPGPGFRSSPLKSIKRKKLGLFLKENVQLIFFLCLAAFRNISMFFNERAAALEKIFNDCFWKKKMWILELCQLKKYFEVKNRLK